MEYGFWDERDGPRPADCICAIGCMDGSWWIDWGQLERLAALPLLGDPAKAAEMLLPRVLLFARGRLPEVTRQRAEEIGADYGGRMSGCLP